MIRRLSLALNTLFPLMIKEASFADPALTLSGDNWSFSTSSAWRVVNGGVLEFGWSDVTSPDRVWDLCGQAIVAVAPQSPLMRGDPAFELSSGMWLEVFSDHAIDPWLLRLPSMTFVGSPSDPAQTD